MRKSWSILVAGFILALVAYFGFYFAGTAHSRSLEKSPEPELAWLKQEFHLTNTEFDRITEMHEAYMSGCAERCRQIDEKNAEIRRLLSETNTVSPEIQQKLADAAALRAECQKQMLQHFYEVSRSMPPEQGKRYLDWVQQRTIMADAHRGMHSDR